MVLLKENMLIMMIDYNFVIDMNKVCNFIYFIVNGEIMEIGGYFGVLNLGINSLICVFILF